MDYREGEIVACKCTEVILDGVEKKVICMTSDNNFCEVDDNGNEILNNADNISKGQKPSKKDLLDMLDRMIADYDKMPSQAMTAPISHFDLSSALLLLSSILRAD